MTKVHIKATLRFYFCLANLGLFIDARKIWAARRFKILSSIANILVYRKNYEKALSVLKQIAEAEYSDKCTIWSCIGKIYIQVNISGSIPNRKY